MEWRLFICASYIVAVGFVEIGLCNGNVILANISQSEGDWQSAMQFCGSPFGSRNSLNTSSDISVNVSSSGEVNQSSWIAAYALYTPWIKMLGCVNITGETLSGLIERQVTLEQVNIFNCFQFCDGLKYFSLSQTECYCFNLSVSSVSAEKCYPQRCLGNNEDFCGENLTSSTVSIMNYQIVTSEFVGEEECLASMFTGIFTENNTSYYGFRAPVVLPCSTPNLGYTYRTRLAFPASHSFRLNTVPVDSWQEAVENSYGNQSDGNQSGLLEFVIFRVPLTDLDQPLEGDRFWVGFLRRHKIEFSSEIPPGSDVHCVAGRISNKGQLVLSYRNCSESLPVLCDETLTKTTTRNLIDNDVGTSSDKELIITTSTLATLLGLGSIVAIVFFIRSTRKQKLQHDYSHYEQQPSTINDKPVYSVLFNKNVEASIYSEVLASDITPNLTEIPSTDTQQRISGYFEMRPKAWLKSPKRDQEKRLNRMSVEMLSTTTERQSYVDMSLENPTPDP